MNHPPSRVLQEYLIEQAIFARPSAGGSWPLWDSQLPDGPDVPDNAAALYDEAPKIDGREMNTNVIVEHPGISFTLRSRLYATGWLKLYSVMMLLADLLDAEVVLEGSTYVIHSVTNRTGVVSQGQEIATRRCLFEMGLNVTMEML